MTPFLAHLHHVPLIAILRGIRPEEAEDVGNALVDAGFRLIEVPLNSPTPLQSIERLANVVGERAMVGAGTVLTAAELDGLHQAGARLVVMPHADAAIVARAKELEMACVPGFATPTEALNMIGAGADALKLFPAEASSPAALRSMRVILAPSLPILPVGGITAHNLGEWWLAGARGFGIGSALYRPGQPATIVGERARALVAALARFSVHNPAA